MATEREKRRQFRAQCKAIPIKASDVRYCHFSTLAGQILESLHKESTFEKRVGQNPTKLQIDIFGVSKNPEKITLQWRRVRIAIRRLVELQMIEKIDSLHTLTDAGYLLVLMKKSNVQTYK